MPPEPLYASGWFDGTVPITSPIGADGLKVLCVIGRDAAGNEQTVASSLTWTKDTVLPTVGFSTPAASAYANSTNVAAFAITGSCDENGRMVTIGGAVSASAMCNGTSWSQTLNLGTVAEGDFTLTADLSDAAGNDAAQATRLFKKDVTAPTAILSNAPTGTNADPALNVTVAGTDVATYKYRTVFRSTPICSATHQRLRRSSRRRSSRAATLITRDRNKPYTRQRAARTSPGRCRR